MAIEIEERVKLVYDLKTTLARQGLTVHYQPQVALSDRRPVGIEALVRWPHPVMGMVAPDRFIGMAERSGLIVEPVSYTHLDVYKRQPDGGARSLRTHRIFFRTLSRLGRRPVLLLPEGDGLISDWRTA